MRRISSAVFAVLMALAIAAPASASTLNITNIIGDWIAGSVVPLGGAVIANTAGQGLDRISWPGVGASSSADFTPSPDILGVPTNTPFALGTFVHNNFPTGATITAVDYTFGFTTNGVPPTLGDTFHLAILDTPNGPTCAPGSISICDDFITVSSLTLNSVINVGGTDFFFSVLGFSQDGGVTISNVFQTQENLSNTSQLYAILTDQPVGVPEPGTLLLVGSGALVAARRLRKRKV